jgi:hypothetical protein
MKVKDWVGAFMPKLIRVLAVAFLGCLNPNADAEDRLDAGRQGTHQEAAQGQQTKILHKPLISQRMSACHDSGGSAVRWEGARLKAGFSW